MEREEPWSNTRNTDGNSGQRRRDERDERRGDESDERRDGANRERRGGDIGGYGVRSRQGRNRQRSGVSPDAPVGPNVLERNRPYWVDVGRSIESLPVSGMPLVETLVLVGVLGLLGAAWLWSSSGAGAADAAALRPVVSLAFFSLVVVGAAFGYRRLIARHRCPSCGREFTFYTVAIERTGRSSHPWAADTIHGKRHLRCEHCGFEDERSETWTPGEIGGFQE